MFYEEYRHRHGKEILALTHEEELNEIATIIKELKPFPHGINKNATPKRYIASAFAERGWKAEIEIPLGT